MERKDLDSHTLRRTAQHKMQSGEVPTEEPAMLAARISSGHPCSLCGTPVDADEVEFTLYFRDDRTDPHYLHLRCYGVWWDERARMRQ